MTGKDALKRLEQQYKRQNEYIKNTYDRITVTLPKGSKEWIKENTGKSCNRFFNDCLAEYQERQEIEELPFS